MKLLPEDIKHPTGNNLFITLRDLLRSLSVRLEYHHCQTYTSQINLSVNRKRGNITWYWNFMIYH